MTPRARTSSPPRCSVIIPAHNRASFIAQAIASVRDQSFADWELIVVDDGSTDDTARIAGQCCAELDQPAQVIRQVNGGPGAARNTGIEAARGRYLAFLDSDDLWLDHHLGRCVKTLEAWADVDWVYGAARVVRQPGDQLIEPDTFRVEGRPRPLLRLRRAPRGEAHLITDPGVIECQLHHGLYAGLQTSVIRRSALGDLRLDPAMRWGEDQVFVVEFLLRGGRIAYFDQVHLIYREHEANLCAAHRTLTVDRQVAIHQTIADGFARLLDRSGSHEAGTMIRRFVAHTLCWDVAHRLSRVGRSAEARIAYGRSLRYWPWDLRIWKSAMLNRIRTRVA